MDVSSVSMNVIDHLSSLPVSFSTSSPYGMPLAHISHILSNSTAISDGFKLDPGSKEEIFKNNYRTLHC